MKKFLLFSFFLLFFSTAMVTKTNAQCSSVIAQGFQAVVSGSTVTYSFSITYPQGFSSILINFYCPDGTFLGTQCYSNQGANTIAYTKSFAIGSCSPTGQYYVTFQAYTSNQCNGNACGGLGRIPVQGPLPVVLANFNAVNKSGKVSLTWETLQEVENDGFEIQRRVGTGKYETVAFVDSKVIGGTGSGTTYSFDDNAPLAKGVTYYRLRQVDLNGEAAFSEVKALRGLGSPIVVSVYPNPSRGTTNVAIPEGTGTMDVTLDDFAGRSVQRWNALNVRNLQLTNLKPGMYLLRITIRETGEQITERITVQ